MPLRLLIFSIIFATACGGKANNTPKDSDSNVDTDIIPETELVCDDGVDDDQDGDLDCDDADCATAIATGGACVNEADLAVYRTLDGNVEWNKCVPPIVGQNCGTDVACNTTCLSDNTGLSSDCAGCMAGLVACLFNDCGTLCAQQPPTAACTSCIDTQCGASYATCFGSLTCPTEVGCRDTVDNDGDGLIDRDDPDCDDLSR